MSVPDDVTLLVCDDNGAHPKPPKPGEAAKAAMRKSTIILIIQGRPGIRGKKRHNPIGQVWQQMHLAEIQCRQIWIVNVRY